VQVNAIDSQQQVIPLVTGEQQCKFNRSPNEESPARLEHGNTEQNPCGRKSERGMTLIELVIGVRDFSDSRGRGHCRSRGVPSNTAEAELRRDLQYMRDCIESLQGRRRQESDSHGVGNENYPPDLETLVNGVTYRTRRYAS